MTQRAVAAARVPVTVPAAEGAAKPRILVVDDEVSMRDMLRIVLRRDGYDVVVAENGQQAVRALQQQHIDLLLSDIRMPDVSGVDVLRAAKEANREIVAFMMTAFASTDTAVEAMRLGAENFLTKPVNPTLLETAVAHALLGGGAHAPRPVPVAGQHPRAAQYDRAHPAGGGWGV